MVLLTGATGSQGGAAADALLARGAAVRALVRDPSSARAQALAARGVELVAGDLRDPASIARAMDGVAAAFGVTMPGPDEVAQGRAIVQAAVDARLAHLVLASVASAREAPEVPHFAAKAEVEAVLAATDVPATVVAPTFFFENLAGARDEVAAGRFPLALPSGVPLQAVALRDLGAVLAEVLLGGERFVGRRLEIAGDARTPAEMAASIGAAAGREVVHVEVPNAQVQARSADLAAMYRFLAATGYAVDLDALRAELPGVAWTSFADWAASAFAPPADQVAAVRRAALEVHRLLLEHQRRAAERLGGRMTAAEVLQAAADDLRFSWLQRLSEPVTALDAGDAPPGQAIGRLRALVAPPDEATAFGRLYLQALQDDPAIVFAHRDLVAALG